MKILGGKAMLRIAFTLVLAIAGLSAPARADQFSAKLRYCTTCHGASGQGYRGFYTMPRLAGQPPKYIENQLRAFREKRRPHLIMSNVAHGVSPSMAGELAEYFHRLNPPALDGRPHGQVSLGRQIYNEGLPESNVPACSTCHGSDAYGRNETPRLAGQLSDYFANKLANWTRERGRDQARPDISRIMVPTAHNLTRAQIAAVAAYVSTLR